MAHARATVDAPRDTDDSGTSASNRYPPSVAGKLLAEKQFDMLPQPGRDAFIASSAEVQEARVERWMSLDITVKPLDTRIAPSSETVDPLNRD